MTTQNLATGCFILVAFYRRLNWDLVKKAVGGTINITVMVFMIIVGAVAFGQNMSMAGASKGLIEFTLGLSLLPIVIMLTMQALILFLGTFMEMTAIMMVTLPLYMPIIIALGFDPVWFAVIYLLNIEISGISPPFGLALFVMKGVAPPDVTIGDIYKAALPFVGINLIVMALLIAFPPIVLWLPGLMR